MNGLPISPICYSGYMARTKYESIDDVIEWIAGLPPQTQLEIAPKRERQGKTPNAHWRPVRRDLTDLPRDEWFTLRVVGTTDGVHVRIASDSSAADSRSAVAVIYSREQLLADREALVQQREAFLEFCNERERDSYERQVLLAKTTGEWQRQARDGMAEAREYAKSVSELMAQLASAHALAAEQNAHGEMSRQLGYAANRIADVVAMWRLKKHYDKGGIDALMSIMPKEWQADMTLFLLEKGDEIGEQSIEGVLSMFLGWRRAKHGAPPVSGDEDDDPTPSRKRKTAK